MKTLNLKKYYYPICKKDTFVEVPDEVADAIVEESRAEDANDAKQHYHCYSLDASPGMEHHFPEQAISPGRYSDGEGNGTGTGGRPRLMMERLREALATLTPRQQAACTLGFGRASSLRRLPRPKALRHQRPSSRFATPLSSCRNIISSAAGWSRQRRKRYAQRNHHPSETEKDEREEVLKEIRQLENRQKILENKQRNEERKARNPAA